MGELATRVAGRIRVRSAAAVLAACIVLLAIGAAGPLWAFTLDAEFNVPAFFSAAVLLAGAALAAALRHSRPERRLWSALGALLLLMAADELFSFHESLESWTGVDWQLLYAPLAPVALAVWALAVRWLDGLPQLAFAAGIAAWALAQTFEWLQWDGDRPVHPRLVPPEELLEMTGSSLFVLALLAALRRALRPGPHGARATRRRPRLRPGAGPRPG